jgi:Protein of unknown function (DUF1569)
MINTKKVRDRRKLRLESLDEAVRDAEALAEAERGGTLRVTGNWTLGQTIGHLAFWASAPFDGYPTMRRPPWLLRLLSPLLKPVFLNKGLPAGVRISGVPAGTFGVDVMPTDEALGRLRAAFARLASQAPAGPNPFFGPMTHDEWIKLNLRHAELHLSFFHPR